jgi:hypothetical protein
MLLLSGGGTEAFVLMPVTFDVSLSFHPHIHPANLESRADMVESPSCGTGEISNSERYSYYPLEL